MLAAARTNARYIGLIGSRARRFYRRDVREHGIPDERSPSSMAGRPRLGDGRRRDRAVGDAEITQERYAGRQSRGTRARDPPWSGTLGAAAYVRPLEAWTGTTDPAVRHLHRGATSMAKRRAEGMAVHTTIPGLSVSVCSSTVASLRRRGRHCTNGHRMTAVCVVENVVPPRVRREATAEP